MSELWIAGAVIAAGSTAYSAYNANKLYGDKPEVPAAPTLGGILSETLSANRAALPGATQLATDVNRANQDELFKNLRNVLGPGVFDDIKNITSDLGKRAQGEFPDLARSEFDRGAVSAIGGGYHGSGMDAAGKFRNIGLKQYEETQKAVGSFQQWLAGAKSLLLAPQIGAASFLATPGMGQEVANKGLDISLYGAKVNAAPDPGTVGVFNQSMGMISTLGTAYAGYAGAKQSRPWLGSAGEAGSGEGSGAGFDWGFGGKQGGVGGQWYWGQQPGRG